MFKYKKLFCIEFYFQKDNRISGLIISFFSFSIYVVYHTEFQRTIVNATIDCFSKLYLLSKYKTIVLYHNKL